MSPIAFSLDMLLALLLAAALFVGLKLDRRLRSLRDGHAHFAKAAAELNVAIARAESGLAEIRGALREADQTLTERVDEARSAARKLEQAMARIPASAPAGAAPVAAAPAPAKGAEDELAALPIKDLLARLRGSLPLEDKPAAKVLDLRTRTEPARSRAKVDDDLFEAPEAFPALRRAGA